jgi:hypothetical protein
VLYFFEKRPYFFCPVLDLSNPETAHAPSNPAHDNLNLAHATIGTAHDYSNLAQNKKIMVFVINKSKKTGINTYKIKL